MGPPRAIAAPPASVAAEAAPRGVAGRAFLAGAARHIAEREYRASANETGLQAPNRRHGLRTYFEPTGIRVHDRTAPGAPRLLGLELVGVRRGEERAPVPPGRVSSEGTRVEIRRRDLVEWYVNSRDGLEQGFTLARRPTGEGPLVLEIAVSGARARIAGSELRIRTAAGRTLAYGALAAKDAGGKALPARFETPGEDRIALVVDDRGARYPVAIDPLLTATADTQLESDQASSFFGGAVAGAGDVNGDGYADVIVGAEEYDAGSLNEGAAFVFLGSATGVADGNPGTAATQLESNQSGALFGTSVAAAGDVNGDGYADVIVGAQAYDNGQADEGAAFVFLGSASGIADSNPASADVAQLEADQATAVFGGAVAGAGDVNGDGYADVIVGSEEYNAPSLNEGAAFVFLGSASGIADGNPASAGVAQLESDQTGALLGTSVAGAGDVNGDGYADVIVGAEAYDAGHVDEGAAFVFLGGAVGVGDGTPATASAQIESDQAGALLAHVAGAGDVNGDGFADVIVGAEEYDAGQTGEGAAFVFLGNGGGDGRDVLAEQLRGDASAIPAQPLGRSHDGGFEVALVATHPEGRGRVRLEIEACPLAAPFGDASCTTQLGTSWTDSTAAAGGVLLAELVAGLDENTLHRWRARVLYAPLSVTEAGITPPPNPAHGPWRRVQAQAVEADIRLPEPSELVLLLSALAGLLAIGRRRIEG
jgi:hypothetical protein